MTTRNDAILSIFSCAQKLVTHFLFDPNMSRESLFSKVFFRTTNHQFLPRDVRYSAVYAVAPCPPVSMSQVGVSSKRLHVGSRKQRITIAYITDLLKGLYSFLLPKILDHSTNWYGLSNRSVGNNTRDIIHSVSCRHRFTVIYHAALSGANLFLKATKSYTYTGIHGAR